MEINDWILLIAVTVVFASIVIAVLTWAKWSLIRGLKQLSGIFEKDKEPADKVRGKITEEKYHGGQIWESPVYLRCMICLAGDGRMMLISDLANEGSCALKERNGKWLYTIPELKKRLKNWKHIGPKIYYRNKGGD